MSSPKLSWFYEMENGTRKAYTLTEDEKQYVKECGICGEFYSPQVEFHKTAYTGDKEVCPLCTNHIASVVVEDYHRDFIRQIWPRPQQNDWGIEIAVAVKNKNTETAKEIRLHGWAVEEGALEDKEIEIVSPPMPYQKLVESLPIIMEKVKKVAVLTNREDISMHVSFNAKEMAKLSILKFVEFISHNPLGLCEMIARREETFYTQYRKFRIFKNNDLQGLWLTIEAMSTDSAVSIRKLPKVEVRIFKSTTNLSEVYTALQFVKAVKDMCSLDESGTCHRSNNPNENVMFEEFVDFVRNKGEYNLLRNIK